jgi:hypothetical protein
MSRTVYHNKLNKVDIGKVERRHLRFRSVVVALPAHTAQKRSAKLFDRDLLIILERSLVRELLQILLEGFDFILMNIVLSVKNQSS